MMGSPCPSPSKRRKIDYIYGDKKTMDEFLMKDDEAGFDMWLAGVNDRINCTMNYQLTTKPTPLIYFIPKVIKFT